MEDFGSSREKRWFQSGGYFGDQRGISKSEDINGIITVNADFSTVRPSCQLRLRAVDEGSCSKSLQRPKNDQSRMKFHGHSKLSQAVSICDYLVYMTFLDVPASRQTSGPRYWCPEGRLSTRLQDGLLSWSSLPHKLLEQQQRLFSLFT